MLDLLHSQVAEGATGCARSSNLRGSICKLSKGSHNMRHDNTLVHVQSGKNGHAAVVAAGSNHNLLITRRGEIFAWGLSSSGELGQRDTPIDQAWPVQVSCRSLIDAQLSGTTHKSPTKAEHASAS